MNPCPLVLETTVLPLNYFPLNKYMLIKYLLEIKNRLIILAVSWILSAVISYYYKETLLFLSLKSLLKNSNETFVYFIATDITEIMTTYFKLAYLTATQIVFVLLAYHFLMFLGPGLYNFEYRMLRNYLFKSICLWLLSFFFLNKYVINICWFFFLSFQKTCVDKPITLYFEGKINEYVSFYITMCFLCLILSQLAVNFSIFLESVEDKITFSKTYRKTCYVSFLIIATLITPPDVYSQILLLFVFSILYEFLLIITIFKKNLIR